METIKLKELYPEGAIAATVEQAERSPKRRRYYGVFTEEVIAVWRAWRDAGVPIIHIAQYNGLLKTSSGVVNRYLIDHPMARRDGVTPPPYAIEDPLTEPVPKRLKEQWSPPEPKPTAVSTPSPPKPQLKHDIVQRPKPSPNGIKASASFNSIRELNSVLWGLREVEGLRVSGRIRIELEIEIGEEGREE